MRRLSFVIGLMLVALATRPSAVAWPSAIMIYGGGLEEPIVVTTYAISDSDAYRFLYGGARKTLGKDLSGRPYLNLAMFWGGNFWKAIEADPDTARTLQPQDAMQHGRLYPPVGAEPAAVEATPFEPGTGCSKDAPCGWTLGPREIETLKRLKVPRF